MDGVQFANSVVPLTDRGQVGDHIESSGVAVHALWMSRRSLGVRVLPRSIRLLNAVEPTIVKVGFIMLIC